MNRTDLQQLAEDRIRDAETLLNAGRWSGAYYLCGYAAECALKACIAKLTNLHDFPDKTTVLDAHTHDLNKLLKVANLQADFDRDSSSTAYSALASNWQIVKDWSERARYRQTQEYKTRQLYLAVTDPSSGVLPWIKGRW